MTRLRRLRAPVIVLIAVVATALAAAGLQRAVDGSALAAGLRAAAADPAGLAIGGAAFATAFVLRALAWQRVLPGLALTHALSSILVALGANHLLPLRLGEPLRVISAVRRAGAAPADAAASTIALRTADVLSLLLLGALAGPAVMADVLGSAGAAVVAGVAAVGLAGVAVLLRRRRGGAAVRPPDPAVLVLTTGAWALEAVLVWQSLHWFGIALSPADALVVLAAAVGAQLVAVAPGGLGTYEAAATAALLAVGVPAGTAVTAALALHAVKTIASLLLGAAASVLPAPALWGRLRLPRTRPPRPAPLTADGPIVLFLPAHDEGPRVAGVVHRAPATVRGIPVEVVVVDDGSDDDTASSARRAGARVVAHPANRGLGAAVRTGLAEAVDRRARAVAFCDADGEYDPAELGRLVEPVLDGRADYVVGSRFAGTIRHMRPHRRAGNLALTAWVRWTVRQPVTDGQSGYRAFSPAAAAAAVVPHDYNYAQVLTIDLLGKGFTYAEVGIDYRYRASGRSFVRLSRYLRRVLPTVWRQLNPGRRFVT